MESLISRFENLSYSDDDFEEYRRLLEKLDFDSAPLVYHDICRFLSHQLHRKKSQFLPYILQFLDYALAKNVSVSFFNNYGFGSLLVELIINNDCKEYTIQCYNMLFKLSYKVCLNLTESISSKFIDEIIRTILQSYEVDNDLFISSISVLVSISFKNPICRNFFIKHDQGGRTCKRALSLLSGDKKDQHTVLAYLVVVKYSMNSTIGPLVFDKQNICQVIEYLFNLLIRDIDATTRFLMLDLFYGLLDYPQIVKQIENFKHFDKSVGEILIFLSMNDRAGGVLDLLNKFMEFDCLKERVVTNLLNCKDLRNRDIAEELLSIGCPLESFNAVIYWAFYHECKEMSLKSLLFLQKVFESSSKSDEIEEKVIGMIDFIFEQLTSILNIYFNEISNDDNILIWLEAIFGTICCFQNDELVSSFETFFKTSTILVIVNENLENIEFFRNNIKKIKLLTTLCSTVIKFDIGNLNMDNMTFLISIVLQLGDPIIICGCVNLLKKLKNGKNLKSILSKCKQPQKVIGSIDTSDDDDLTPISIDKDSNVSELVNVYEKRLKEMTNREEQFQLALQARNTALLETDKLLQESRLEKAANEAERRELLRIVTKIETDSKTVKKLHRIEIEKMTNLNRALAEEKHVLKQTAVNYETKLEEVETHMKKLSMENKKLRKCMEEQKIMADKKDVILGEKNTEIDRLDNAVKTLRSELTNRDEAMKNLQDVNSTLEKDLRKSNNKIKELQDQLEKLSDLASVINGLTSGKIDASALKNSFN